MDASEVKADQTGDGTLDLPGAEYDFAPTEERELTVLRANVSFLAEENRRLEQEVERLTALLLLGG